MSEWAELSNARIWYRVAEPLLRAYVEVSPDGADHFRTVIAKAAAASAENGRPATQLARLDLPALVIVGDDDFVDLRHAIDMYEAPAAFSRRETAVTDLKMANCDCATWSMLTTCDWWMRRYFDASSMRSKSFRARYAG